MQELSNKWFSFLIETLRICYIIVIMFGVTDSIRKVIALLFLVAVVSTFVFAYLHIKSVAMSDIAMPGCPFMDKDTSALCTMSPLEHIEAWRHLLTVTPASSAILLILLSLLIGKRKLHLYTKLAEQLPLFARQFLRRALSVTTCSALNSHRNDFHQYLFSRCILHPKLY